MFMLQHDGTDATPSPFSSNFNPSSTSAYDHEHDDQCNCHAQHIHRGSITGGTDLEAAQKLDPILGTDEGSTISHSTHVDEELHRQISADPKSCTVANSRTGDATTLKRHTSEPSRYGTHKDYQAVQERGSNGESCRPNDNVGSPDGSRTSEKHYKSTCLNLLDAKTNYKGTTQTRSSGA